MRYHRSSKINTVLLPILVGCGVLLFGTGEAPAQVPEGMEVQTRGPVHEAYAELAGSDAGMGMVVPKAPPAAIEEIPPEERPEGDEYAWIPGYWGWDEGHNDFLWISGIWRIPPPDCNWTPGYWTQADGGAQWVAGFWLSNEIEVIDYYPAPPESLEAGPQSDPTSQDQIWAPGSWVWADDRYVWQPGYWMDGRPDWVYTPTHYNWTPLGYVCVSGYWDYPIDNRGVLFAPVYFSQPVYDQPDFRYSPNVLIDTGGLTNNLFRYPRYNHYVFGDYYGNESAQLGIVPWFQLNVGHQQYDPIYAHQRWTHGRHDTDWSDRVQADYQHRMDNAEVRPPRVYDGSPNTALSHPDSKANHFVHARTLQQVVGEKDSTLKLIKIDSGERDNISNKTKDFRRFTQERVQREALQAQKAGEAPPEGRPVKVEKLRIPKSPIKSVRKSAVNDSKAPPPLPETPKAGSNVQAVKDHGQGGQAANEPRKVKERSKNVPDSRPIPKPREQGQGETNKGNSGQGTTTKILDGNTPSNPPPVNQAPPKVHPGKILKEQENPKVDAPEKTAPKGHDRNVESRKNKVRDDKGVPPILLPQRDPRPNKSLPPSIQGAPNTDGAGKRSKDQRSSGRINQAIPRQLPDSSLNAKQEGSPKAPSLNRDPLPQLQQQTAVNRNQGGPKNRMKANPGAQLEPRPVHPPTTPPPPVQAQGNNPSKGKGKGKN